MRRLVLVLAVAAVLAPSVAAGARPHVSPADRAGIDSTLDVFVPAAVARAYPARAWELASPAMRRGVTRADWAKGTLPVVPYPAGDRNYHGWTVDAVRPGAVDIVLLVHPRKHSKVGPASFDITMKKVGGRWVVDSFVAAALFAPAGEVSSITAQPDLAPSPKAVPYSKTGRIAGGWLYAIVAVLVGLIVVVPIGVVVAHRARDRRALRGHEASMKRA